MKKFSKFKKKLKSWKTRDLTLRGKKLLINSYIMSSISYLADLYPHNVPPKFVKETKALICEFLWSGKTWKISQKNLALKHEHGGLELKDIDNFIECKKVKWILRIYSTPIATWNAYGKHCLQRYDELYGVNDFLVQCSNCEPLLKTIPMFYKSCLAAWSNVVKKTKIVTKNDVLKQNICGNDQLSKKHQSIFLPHWTKSKLITINDLWDSTLKKWKTSLEIYQALVCKRNWIGEYQKIKDYMPADWKAILLDTAVQKSNDLLTFSKELCLSQNVIYINNKKCKIWKCKGKRSVFHMSLSNKPTKCSGSLEQST